MPAQALSGLAMPGLAWPRPVKSGQAQPGLHQPGQAWQGLARPGQAWLDLVKTGQAGLGLPRPGHAWPRMARRSQKAWYVLVWHNDIYENIEKT